MTPAVRVTTARNRALVTGPDRARTAANIFTIRRPIDVEERVAASSP